MGRFSNTVGGSFIVADWDDGDILSVTSWSSDDAVTTPSTFSGAASDPEEQDAVVETKRVLSGALGCRTIQCTYVTYPMLG